MAMYPCDALADVVYLDDTQWPYVVYGTGADFSTLSSWKSDYMWQQVQYTLETVGSNSRNLGQISGPLVRAYMPSDLIIINNEYCYIGMSYYAGQGNRIVRAGEKLRLVPVGAAIGYSTNADVFPTYNDARIGFYRVWVKNSGQEVSQITPDEDGNFTVPVDSQFLLVTFRLDWPSRLAPYLVMPMPRILLVEESDSYVTQTQTDTLMDTTGSDQIVDQNNVGQMTEDIQNLTVFESFTEIADTVKEAVTTTDEDPTITFPGLSFQGFTMPAVTVNVWDNCPIPQATVRGFITFVFVCMYVNYMHDLIQNIFALRFYSEGAYSPIVGDYDDIEGRFH